MQPFIDVNENIIKVKYEDGTVKKIEELTKEELINIIYSIAKIVTTVPN